MKSYRDWCAAHDCSHAHCPYDCEHPQPYIDEDGTLLCGRCFWEADEHVVMEPCNKETCPDE